MLEEKILEELKNIRKELKKIADDVSNLSLQATTLDDIDSDLEEILKEMKNRK